MTTYLQICEELAEEATRRQRLIGAMAGAALGAVGVNALDKAPAEKVMHQYTTGEKVMRTVVHTKPATAPSGSPFKVNGKTYVPYFPQLAHLKN